MLCYTFMNGIETHGSGGPLKVERPLISEFTNNMMRAGQELGYGVRDPNGYGPYTEGT